MKTKGALTEALEGLFHIVTTVFNIPLRVIKATLHATGFFTGLILKPFIKGFISGLNFE